MAYFCQFKSVPLANGEKILVIVITVAVWPENPFSPLLTRPQGPKGCHMKRHHSLNMPQKVWCTKIDPKLNKLQKTIKIEEKLDHQKRVFFEGFSNFLQIGVNFSTPNLQKHVKWIMALLLVPLGSLGVDQ